MKIPPLTTQGFSVILALWSVLAFSQGAETVTMAPTQQALRCAGGGACEVLLKVERDLPGRRAQPPSTMPLECTVKTASGRYSESGYAWLRSGVLEGSVTVELTGQTTPQPYTSSCTVNLR